MKDEQTATAPSPDADLARLEALATLLDNQFRIPGTNVRFGLDGLIGLVPYLGDIAGFAVSGVLFSVMLKRGASPLILMRMMGNLALDAVVGAIPLLGDLFDFGYKANRRNVDLLRRYYAEPGQTQRALVRIFPFADMFFSDGGIGLADRLVGRNGMACRELLDFLNRYYELVSASHPGFAAF
ncbi:MAG: DUF4112 domain-containing protein [Saprospirales bacterium]|nr:DUF4112 domain-containing protein [Saprospirales bacterium]